MELITQSEFARRKGISKQLVSRSIQEGRIKTEKSGKINWITEADEWENNADPSQRKDKKPADLKEAKLEKEIYLGKRQRLAYERDSKKVIDIDLVRTEIFKQTRLLRDAVLIIPDRVASSFTARIIEHLREIIPEKEANKIRVHDIERIALRIWEKESREALEKFSNGPRI